MKENKYRNIYKMLVDKLKNRLMELQSTDLEEIIMLCKHLIKLWLY